MTAKTPGSVPSADSNALQLAKKQLENARNRHAPYAHQTALEALSGDGLAAMQAGFEAVFGKGRATGLIDVPPQLTAKRPAMELRQGQHVPHALDEGDPRLVKIGLLVPDLGGEEGTMLAPYLTKQARAEAVAFVILSTTLRWLPVIGYLGLGFCAMAPNETTEEACSRAVERYDLSLITDVRTHKTVWKSS